MMRAAGALRGHSLVGQLVLIVSCVVFVVMGFVLPRVFRRQRHHWEWNGAISHLEGTGACDVWGPRGGGAGANIRNDRDRYRARVGLRASAAGYTVGDPVLLTLCIRNESDERAKIFPVGADLMRVRVFAFGHDGRPVPDTYPVVVTETNTHAGGSQRPFGPDPREEQDYELDASALLRFSRPGTYRVVVQYDYTTSNAALVTILPRGLDAGRP